MTKTAKLSFAQRIEALRAVQKQMSRAGKSDKECERLSAVEDQAYIAIGRCGARTFPEFQQKLEIMFEALGDLVPSKIATHSPFGDFGGGSAAAMTALIQGVKVDAARLFSAETDAELIDLCRQYHETVAWTESRCGTGAVDEGHPEHDAWEAAIDRRVDLEWKIARKLPKTPAGAAEQIRVLQDDLSHGTPGDDRADKMLESVASGLTALSGFTLPPPTVDAPVKEAA